MSGQGRLAPLVRGLAVDLIRGDAEVVADNALLRQQPTVLYAVAHSARYRSAFHDITHGSSGAYTAGPGWDLVTGWGTPNVANLAGASLRLKPRTRFPLLRLR